MAKDIATKLNELLDRQGTTVAKLSRAIKVAPTTVRRWTEPDTRFRPKIHQLLAVSRFFGVTMEYLADDQIEEPITGSADESMVLSHFRVQLRKEPNFTPDELAWRIAEPRPGPDPTTVFPADPKAQR